MWLWLSSSIWAVQYKKIMLWKINRFQVEWKSWECNASVDEQWEAQDALNEGLIRGIAGHDRTVCIGHILASCRIKQEHLSYMQDVSLLNMLFKNVFNKRTKTTWRVSCSWASRRKHKIIELSKLRNAWKQHSKYATIITVNKIYGHYVLTVLLFYYTYHRLLFDYV